MFRKTYLELAIRNMIVLFVILISLSILLYGYMKAQLFERVDESLKHRVPVTASSTKTLQVSQPFALRVANLDRPVFQLLWLSDDRLLDAMPVFAELSKEELKLFSPSKFTEKPQNLKVGEQYFRVLTTPANVKFIGANRQGQFSQKIKTIQYVANVSAEVNMLNRLLLVLLAGGGIGLITAMSAGIYLARSALVPIRTSWEKQQLFVSDASHELRTPLSVIQTYSEILLRHPDRTIEQESKHISSILKETKRMSRLVESLLTLAREDSNQTEIDIKSVTLSDILADVVQKMSYLAELKGIDIQTEIEDAVQMNGDKERLHQFFVILIDNALKYTQQGGCVCINMKRHGQTVGIEIEDTGIGISAEDLPFIFDRFYRGDRARTRAEHGAGLGLSIAKWIAESHGGKIWAESTETGTIFLTQLPCDLAIKR